MKNLLYDLIKKFGADNISVDRENWLLKVSNTNLIVVLDFIDFNRYDTVKMVVVDEDSVLIYCNPEFK